MYADLKYHWYMCLGRNIVCRDRMLKEKIISGRTKMVLNHFSHNGISSVYDEFKPIANNNGFEISYDGMEITV